VSDPELRKAYEAMKADAGGAAVSLKIAAAAQEPVRLRNVVGILRGSDPALRDTYVLVSAHYDHVGICSNGPDRICNGANDDASGTASVIELASTLAKMREKPRRSLVFVAYFGEERGLYGSRYYGRHPMVPLEKTVADINLEQLGRTDDSEGPQVGSATLTGFDYSDISATFVQAGRLTGIRVSKSEKRSDSYFARSDNQALADVGIPAHTLLVAYDFPDYHRPGDEWQKLDYANMEKVDRMIAAGLLMIADNPVPPKWNTSNPKTERYVKAWEQRKGN
jgi:Zn-dependent M28 family amino/carboxypeptidase